MSIIGDSGDNVIGVNGIGSKRIYDIIDDLVKEVGGIDNLRNNVINDKSIFVPSLVETPNKYLKNIIEKEESEKLVSKNLKLVDFEIISNFFDNPSETETLHRKKNVINTLSSNNIVPINKLKPALEMAGVYLQEELETIYYQS
jgi:5'-3' exonuclease